MGVDPASAVEDAATAASNSAIAVPVARTAASRPRLNPPLVSGVGVTVARAFGETTTSGPPGVRVRVLVGVGLLVAAPEGVFV